MFDNILRDKDKIEERLSYCKVCEYNKMGICSQCACIIETKVRVKSSFCPLVKWNCIND